MEKETFHYFKLLWIFIYLTPSPPFPCLKIYLKWVKSYRICYDAVIQEEISDPRSPQILYSYQEKSCFHHIFKKCFHISACSY